MFNNLQHGLMCEIEALSNSANAAIEYCENEEWQFITPCIAAMMKHMKAIIKFSLELGLIQPPQKNNNEAVPTKVEIIDTTSEDSNA